jgi:hypothetical protein
MSLLLDARGMNAVAFPDKRIIPHLTPAIGKPSFNAKLKIKNAKWKTKSSPRLPFCIFNFALLIL